MTRRGCAPDCPLCTVRAPHKPRGSRWGSMPEEQRHNTTRVIGIAVALGLYLALKAQ